MPVMLRVPGRKQTSASRNHNLRTLLRVPGRKQTSASRNHNLRTLLRVPGQKQTSASRNEESLENFVALWFCDPVNTD